MNPTTLPDNVLSKMDATERKRIGKAGRTTAQIVEANTIKSEKELQRQCVALLRLRGIFVIVSRMDRKTSNQVGTPDLIFSLMRENVVIGRPCAFECKLKGNKPTPEQEKVMGQMASNGWTVRVIHTVEQMRDELRQLEQ